MKYVVFLMLLAMVFSSSVFGHGGRKDSNGCHRETATNTRHCHPMQPTTTPRPVIPAITPVPLQCNAATPTRVTRALSDARLLESRLSEGRNTPQQVIDWASWHLENYPGQSSVWNRLISIARGML